MEEFRVSQSGSRGDCKEEDGDLCRKQVRQVQIQRHVQIMRLLHARKGQESEIVLPVEEMVGQQ
jgi:hypothetical protein